MSAATPPAVMRVGLMAYAMASGCNRDWAKRAAEAVPMVRGEWVPSFDAMLVQMDQAIEETA